MGNNRFGKRKSLGSRKWNRVIYKIRLKKTTKSIASRAAKLIMGYKEYDTVWIYRKDWKNYRLTQYRPVDKTIFPE